MVPRFVLIYFRVISLVTAAMGGTLLLYPRISELFFNNPPNSTLFFTQIIGSTLLGYAALNGITSLYTDNVIVFKIASWSNLVTLCIASVLCTIYTSRVDTNAWLLIVQHLVFTAGFVACVVLLKNKNRDR